MKQLLFFIVACAAITLSHAQTNLYENPDFDEIAKNHKIIAIVPFKTQVKLRPRQMEKLGEGDLERMEKSEGESLQNGMYSWFLKRKKRGKLAGLELQDPKRTNALLK